MSANKGSEMVWSTEDANKFAEELHKRDDAFWGESVADEEQGGNNMKAWRKLAIDGKP
jgi:hypothetical protein